MDKHYDFYAAWCRSGETTLFRCCKAIKIFNAFKISELQKKSLTDDERHEINFLWSQLKKHFI